MIRTTICTDPSLRSYTAQHAVAERLLRRALSRLGITGGRLDLVTNGHGKPVLAALPGIHLNVSHCAGAVLVAVSDQRIGVDVENIRPWDGYAASRVLQPREIAAVAASDDPDREFFRHWTAKESYLKALGVGILVYPARRLAVVVGPDGSVRLNRAGVALRLDEAVDGYLQAICRLHGNPVAGVVAERVDLADL